MATLDNVYTPDNVSTSRPCVLFVGSREYGRELRQFLGDAGWGVECVESAAAAVARVRNGDFTLGLFDFTHLELADWEAAEDRLLATHCEWMAILPADALRNESMRYTIARRFFDYYTAPVEASRLMITMGHAVGMARLRMPPPRPDRRSGMIGHSPAMQRLNRDLARVARHELPVLLTGETGTGKELAARTLHQQSARAQQPLVIVDCGSLPTHLIQAELFGHEKGAFTGADRQRPGRIEAAHGGTLFLDEIGDLPLEQQVSLLRFLQEGTVQRLGSTAQIRVDARVIAATHVDLRNAVAHGRFREDLYYRLNVIALEIPPLRDRREDIVELAEACFEEFRASTSTRARGFSRDALLQMLQYDWPGNVRELRNRVQRAMVMGDHRLLTADDLDFRPRHVEAVASLRQARLLAERDAIERALTMANNNRTRAAEELQISRITLYRLLNKHGLLDDDEAIPSPEH